MQNIPEIDFRQDKRSQGCELIDLNELFNRGTEYEDHSPFLPHRPHFFIILILLEGQLEHSIDFTSYQLQPGDCLLVSKGQVHNFSPPQPGMAGYMFLFTEEFMLQHIAPSSQAVIQRLYNYHLHSPLIPAPRESEAFIRQIKSESNSSPPGVLPQLSAAHFTIFLLKLQELVKDSQPPESAGYRAFSTFRYLLREQFAQTRNAKDYAKVLGISYKHLNEVCKGLTGQTAKAFIDHYIVMEAKRLLISTSYSIKEISYACGFEEQTNFAKYFRKVEGKSPARFRHDTAKVRD